MIETLEQLVATRADPTPLTGPRRSRR
jgi:hypothetical protein